VPTGDPEELPLFGGQVAAQIPNPEEHLSHPRPSRNGEPAEQPNQERSTP